MIYNEKIVNAITGEETLRPYTEAEIAAVEAEQTLMAAEQAERDAEQADKAEQKAALLNRLGITEAEAKLLLS